MSELSLFHQSILAHIPAVLITHTLNEKYKINESFPQIVTQKTIVLYTEFIGISNFYEKLSSKGKLSNEYYAYSINHILDIFIGIICRNGGDVVKINNNSIIIIWPNIKEREINMTWSKGDSMCF